MTTRSPAQPRPWGCPLSAPCRLKAPSSPVPGAPCSHVLPPRRAPRLAPPPAARQARRLHAQARHRSGRQGRVGCGHGRGQAGVARPLCIQGRARVAADRSAPEAHRTSSGLLSGRLKGIGCAALADFIACAVQARGCCRAGRARRSSRGSACASGTVRCTSPRYATYRTRQPALVTCTSGCRRGCSPAARPASYV
jgi:hypothetical protein